jgi:stage IV sporulation protein FB
MTLIVNDTRYKIDFTFALTVTLMVILCKDETVIISLLSSVLHEMGHLFCMYCFGQRVDRVTFGAFGIRIDRQLTRSLSYKREAVIAGGGIVVNFIIALVGVVGYYITDSFFCLKLTLVNIIIALFNMIPVDTLDMGRVLRYTLLVWTDESKCDRILSIISFISLIFLGGICFLYSLLIGFNPSLIIVTLYLYVITLFKKWS